MIGQVRFTTANLMQDFKGNAQLILSLEKDSVYAAKQILNELPEGQYIAEIKQNKKKRSLDANAYFHVLVQQIAEKLKLGLDETKKMLAVEYGTLARDDSGQIVGFMLPASVKADNIYPYTKAYDERIENGKEVICYLLYKRSSEMNSKEFSRLLDGAQTEAKSLGIPTLDDMKISEMMKNYKGGSHD